MSTAALYKTLHLRKRPEDVADIILSNFGERFDSVERALLNKAAVGALKNKLYAYTSMSQEWATLIGARKQVDKAIELFELDRDDVLDPDDPAAVRAFIARVSALLRKRVGRNNFLTDRLNREEREVLKMDISKRAYNKRWRLLKRLEAKLEKMLAEIEKTEFQKISKHGLAHRISEEDMNKDVATACFIAYYNSRCNLRSTFTNTSQVRAFDDISQMLLKRCTDTANWWAIAHIYPAPLVLQQISDEQKGELLGTWTGVLQDISTLLSKLWEENSIDNVSMIVRRGNDSSTWNHTAGAWNKARDSWMQLIYALGMEYILEVVCFGKVMRLMAGDVVYWHHRSGGGLDPNTMVWNDLPFPWEVFDETAVCTRLMVKTACRRAGIDPEKSGWVAPRKHAVATFSPTPELVHGVAVGSPFLATYLRRNKVFSGKLKL